jgi:hypothetical protein
MPRQYLSIYCKVTGQKHETLKKNTPDADFCTFCGHDFNPDPIEISLTETSPGSHSSSNISSDLRTAIKQDISDSVQEALQQVTTSKKPSRPKKPIPTSEPTTQIITIRDSPKRFHSRSNDNPLKLADNFEILAQRANTIRTHNSQLSSTPHFIRIRLSVFYQIMSKQDGIAVFERGALLRTRLIFFFFTLANSLFRTG